MRGKAGLFGLIGAAVLLALGLVACGGSSSSDSSSSPEPSASPVVSQTIKVSEGVLPQKVHLKVGDQLKVVLHSNVSTGYRWTAEGMEEEAVLRQEGKPAYIAPKSTLVGASGKSVFTFTAVEQGVEQLGFWYARPSEKDNPGAAYGLVVTVGKGHLPVEVKAGEEYTAEMAELRTGDTLVVTIRRGSDQGHRTWKMIQGSPLVTMVSQKFSGTTETVTLKGATAGTGTLVLVNRPAGDFPLQTYALPVHVKTPKQPVTLQMNRHDDGENFAARAGDTIQVTLPDQPSTDVQWQFQKPNVKVLKQVGKPKFTPNSDVMGARGKMEWTFRVVGAGKTPLIADYSQVSEEATPIKTWQVNVAAKPGTTPKTVGAVDAYPAETMDVLPGDRITVQLDAKAGIWAPQGTSKQLVASKPVTSGSTTIVTYEARNRGITTQVLWAEPSAGWPAQAYAFSAVVGKGGLPKTVTAAERKVARTIEVKAGDRFDIVLPGNPTTGYVWTLSPLADDGVVEEIGQPTFAPESDEMGAPGTFAMHFKAVGAGSVPMILLYEKEDGQTDPASMYMTMVTVQ